MRTLRVLSLLLAAGCASSVPVCQSGDKVPKLVKIENGIFGYPLCAADGTLVAVEIAAVRPVVRNHRDALRLVERLYRPGVGEFVADGAISVESAGRSSRRAYYENGLLQLFFRIDQQGNGEHVAFATFWPFRRITESFSDCRDIAVIPPSRSAKEIVGAGGAMTTLQSRVVCDGETLETLLAAGPLGPSFPRPDIPDPE